MQHTVIVPFAHHFKNYANPMVHPVTGETTSSHKKLMHNPVSAEIWQTAFGKDFGGMAQGDNKMGQKGTNALFVMTHEEIQEVLQAGKKITYANPSGEPLTAKGGCKLDLDCSGRQFDQLR